ncbi:MAG TPA: hypothetical protein VJN71_07960 [Nitrososphaerales archaeon]|nr:hypothetical protein [Nitrososphaerales archaeon]
MKRWKTKWYAALAVFVVPWFFWLYAVSHASNSQFTEDQLALQLMVLGGAISMVAGSIAAFWD